MQKIASLDIVAFVEQHILPRYNTFDKSHGLIHVQRVIANSMTLAQDVGADLNMAYVIAAYHDLGMEGPRAIHHLTSGKILIADARLKKWFSPEQLRIMKEAVEDHRASLSRTPRSIYGKIVAEANRNLEPKIVFHRAIQYVLKKYPTANKEQVWQYFYNHIKEKYGRTGYIKLWIPNSTNAKYLDTIYKAIENEDKLRQIFYNIYQKQLNTI
ncbi:HD domain protein [Prevotella amnii]|uniref:HD domain protein n=1 Tax=Prevotella amnii TaxID=419005 RepID=A0A134BJH4_9BACT|nr:HD domain-containing protein [Prevotella amnii]KXB80090.1 HD domain protein [Prevotella amnii]